MSSEYSPLLRHQSRTSHHEPEDYVATISSALNRVRSTDYRLVYIEDICPPSLLDDGSVADRFSFALIVLLKLRKSRLNALSSPTDIWEHYSQQNSARDDVDILDERVKSIWSTFLAEYRTYVELEDVLWTPFPLDDHSRASVRVIDLLTDRDAPSVLLCNTAVLRSIESYWVHGPYLESGNASFGTRSLRRWDNMTPKVAHFLALLSHLTHLALLAHYLLLTPTTSSGPQDSKSQHIKPGAREIILIILSFGNMLHLSLLSLPFLVVFICFLVSLPSIPEPDSVPFVFLLISFVVLFVQLHLPRYPSPIFLAPHKASLPLSIFLTRGLSHVIFPVLCFFLPGFLLAGFLLSISLKDNPFLRSLDSPAFAPMSTRETFLALTACTVLFFLGSLVLVSPSPAMQHRDRRDWDKFSPSVGIDARRLLVRSTAHYAEFYRFPPPLNVFNITFTGLRLVFGHRTIFLWMEVALWRVFVGPLNAFINGAIWFMSREGLLRTIGV